MEGPTKNLCAQIPVELHNHLRAEQERSGLTLSAYMTDLLTRYYGKGSERTMEGMRTMAFQMGQLELLQVELLCHVLPQDVGGGKKPAAA